jgi:3-hydroxymyristoyl/3-hydroxydecanoyl-(acyl carrier protein) dehydratase
LLESTDRIPVERIGPGQYSARIPRELVFFRGHFDAFAILPGAVLVERVVWPLAKSELPDATLRGIRRLRFQKPIVPEQELAVTLKHQPGRVLFEVSSSDQPVASGQLLVE